MRIKGKKTSIFLTDDDMKLIRLASRFYKLRSVSSIIRKALHDHMAPALAIDRKREVER